MAKKLLKYFSAIDWRLYVIIFFCIMGLIRNAMYFGDIGFNYSRLETKIYTAMIVIYGAQLILLLLREHKAWIISALQVFFCFYVYQDYTFVPIANMIHNTTWRLSPDMSYGWINFMDTTLASALFCMELLKTYFILVLTDEVTGLKRRRPDGRRPARSRPSAKAVS